ncbi:aldehyde dehydrogenase family protein [Arenibaculum pallidiluteum]|uniref:aldehyde dehydrogenase family protein n=1 Tax=Arenibaculum pallidiluteum TaxID=2812559 RepID=UPI001A96C998|nr:aldehyde dehydrogenase family protein [Arenibaculum pallidiluteum]
MTEHGLLIGGEWEHAAETIPTIDPSDGTVIARLARGTAADVDRAVTAAEAALSGAWGALPAFERGRILTRIGALILEHQDALTRIEAADVGKPLRQARADVIACARYFEFYGGAADKVMGDTIPFLDGYTVLTLREPHGVTGHIIPWNYPLQILGRSVAAALAMGNACVLKPAEDASLSALMVARLAIEAGLPPGALNVVTGLGEEAGAALARHPGVNHLSFTGSVEVGRLIQAAAALNTIPVTLELGGKSPQLVFADADLDAALPFVVNAVIQNAGQTCSAGSRLLVEDAIYDTFLARVAERFRALRAGPASRDLDLGPVVNAGQRERVERFLALARKDGLPILAEGTIEADVPSEGHYVRPTLIGDVPPDHPLAQEEVFGPVLSAIRVRDEEHALEVANGTPYGLVAGIWTRDGGRQFRLARRLKAGQVFINNYGAAGGVELPFGGVKASGHGREKGFEALLGFSTTKTVALRHG